MMNNPTAIFDVLYIGSRLQKKVIDFSMYEVQFFCYFSCLLSLYDGNETDSWGYNFVRTDLGSPYCPEVHQAISTLTGNGSLDEIGEVKGYYQVSQKGNSFLEYYTKAINSISWRVKYLEVACSSLSLLPIGSIKEAINNEPVLRSARLSLAKKNLLLESNPATIALHAQFKALKIALEDKYNDLLVPAVVWIEALNNQEPVKPVINDSRSKTNRLF